jgi:hypothetical protein
VRRGPHADNRLAGHKKIVDVFHLNVGQVAESRRDDHQVGAGECFKAGDVVVGVGADLPVTIADAQGIAQLLCGSARCAYPSDQVQLLTGAHARRHDILAALAQLWLDPINEIEI